MAAPRPHAQLVAMRMLQRRRLPAFSPPHFSRWQHRQTSSISPLLAVAAGFCFLYAGRTFCHGRVSHTRRRLFFAITYRPLLASTSPRYASSVLYASACDACPSTPPPALAHAAATSKARAKQSDACSRCSGTLASTFGRLPSDVNTDFCSKIEQLHCLIYSFLFMWGALFAKRDADEEIDFIIDFTTSRGWRHIAFATLLLLLATRSLAYRHIYRQAGAP